jgi:hypothetical protein
MTDYFEELELEFRAAVPRAARSNRPQVRRITPGALVAVVAVAVAIAVVIGAIALLGHRHAPTPPTHRFHRAPAQSFQYPLGAVPTLAQLEANFAVLRRPQTARDRAWKPDCSCGDAAHQLWGLTRYVRTLPGGYTIHLDVEQFRLGGQLNMAAGSYVLNITILDPHGPSSATNFGPNTQYTVSPISSGGGNSVFASIIPDGVARVRWTFDCRPMRAQSPCTTGLRHPPTVAVVNNVAAAEIHTGTCPGPGGCVHAREATWYDRAGRVIAQFTFGANLADPPFVRGARDRTLRALDRGAVAGVTLGSQIAPAVAALTRRLGSPAVADRAVRSCGIRHEWVWTSPAVAQLFTVYEKAGRFAGYRYGAPVSQIGLQNGPGAVLTTGRGLAVGDTVSRARRVEGSLLRTSSRGGGEWRADPGPESLRGGALPARYNPIVVDSSSRIAWIGAGDTGCAGASG